MTTTLKVNPLFRYILTWRTIASESVKARELVNPPEAAKTTLVSNDGNALSSDKKERRTVSRTLMGVGNEQLDVGNTE